MTTCRPASSLSIEEALQLDKDDVLLKIGTGSSLVEATTSRTINMSVQEFLQSDLEDLEPVTMIQLLGDDNNNNSTLMPRLERLLLQRRKQGHRVRVVSGVEIPDWGAPMARNTSEVFVYENDCRFQMRMQR